VGGINTLGTHTSSGLIRGGLGFGTRGRTAQEALLMEGMEAAGKEPGMAANADINAFNRLMVLTAKHHGNQVLAEQDLRDWYASDRNEYHHSFKGQELDDKIADARARMANVGGYTAGRAAAAFVAMGRDGTAIRDVEDMGEVAAMVSDGSEAVAYRLISQVGSDSKRAGRSELAPSQENRAKLAHAAVEKHAQRTVPNYDLVIDQATMSGAGGATGIDVLSNAPSRVVRGNVEHGVNIIRRYMNEDAEVKAGRMTDSQRSVSHTDAAQAAAVIQDLKNSAEAGYGKVDNKITFHTAMAQEDRETLLARFLTEAAPARPVPAAGPPSESGGAVFPTGAQGESNVTLVNRLVGDKYTRLTPEQLQMMSQAERADYERRMQEMQDKGQGQ